MHVESCVDLASLESLHALYVARRILAIIPAPASVFALEQLVRRAPIGFADDERGNERSIARVEDALEDTIAQLVNRNGLAQKLADVGDAAAYRFHTLRLDLAGLRSERGRDVVEIRIEKKCAVAEHSTRCRELCVSRDFSAVRENVVPTADLGRNAELAQYLYNRFVEEVVAIEAGGHIARHEAEVQIAEIVVHCTAAGHATHDANAARVNDIGVDLLDRVLIASDDDRGRVDVEEQQVIVPHSVAEYVLLERQIESRVGNPTIVDKEHEERCTREHTSALSSRTSEERITSSDFTGYIAIEMAHTLAQYRDTECPSRFPQAV